MAIIDLNSIRPLSIEVLCENEDWHISRVENVMKPHN